ncbi:FAD/NAD(P)-binding domain-containing protein [Xylariaceae sp. AK1471]|nr:FAD/NAD(P)-binding domain-containing protein [Xylariaceae sp. AK1471]
MPAQSSFQPPTAGVVGAGIAGLSAAIALRRAGFQVQVYERSRFGNEIGAAISAPPNATAVLRRWGFDFAAAGVVPNVYTRHAAAGDLRTVLEFKYEDIETVMGAPSLSFHRVDLHRGLRDLATEGEEDGESHGGNRGMPVAIRLGCEVQSVDCENGVLTLVDGTKVQKDLVIIADGAHSHLLADFLGHPAPAQPTGRSIYRWLVSMDDVMADLELAEQYRDQLPGFISWFDAAKRMLWVSYTCRGGTVLNSAVVHDTEDHPSSQPQFNDNENGQFDNSSQSEWAKNGQGNGENILWHIPVAKETILKNVANFHPAVRRIVSMASEDGIRVHRLFKRPPLESFVHGRAAVIGDAAHVMMPTHAAGCAIAIESASVLEVLFRDLDAHPDSSSSGHDVGGETEGGTSTKRQEKGVDEGRKHLIRERLQLFDKLRIPRCNLTLLVSNAGPDGLRVPGVEEEIRRFYQGPLPPNDALPWSQEFREVLFHYDAFEAAEQALNDERERERKYHSQE